jgi:hypothetical protein
MSAIWQLIITENMVKHLNQNELSLFIDTLEDTTDEVLSNFDVVWEGDK